MSLKSVLKGYTAMSSWASSFIASFVAAKSEKTGRTKRDRIMRKKIALLAATISLAVSAASFRAAAPDASAAPSPAEWVDSRLGTARAFGSNVLGPCVPYGSAHPSPDSLWPTPHSGARGSHHGFGAPTSGWWPGDKVVGFSQLHAQGTGGTPSYGIFRYVCDPQGMERLEAHPYLLKVRLKPSPRRKRRAPHAAA